METVSGCGMCSLVFVSGKEGVTMAISAISGYSRIQNIYAFRNTHYNEVQTTPVTPVPRPGKVAGISDDEDELRFAAIDAGEKKPSERLEISAVNKQTEKIQSAYETQGQLQYDLTNPYEVGRKSVEGMLVSGMNFNVLA